MQQHKVESFPFNVTSSPMYTGSTLSFLATALWYVTTSKSQLSSYPETDGRSCRPACRYESPAGILLSVLVYIEYQIALSYEEYVVSPLATSATLCKRRAAVTVADSDRICIVQPLHRRHLRQARVGPRQGQGQASQPGQERYRFRRW